MQVNSRADDHQVPRLNEALYITNPLYETEALPINRI
jgi:hypothetical protein